MNVLITGASSGIGREMARILAPQCDKLVLVGRDTARLSDLQRELAEKTGGQVVAEATDLTSEENCRALHASHGGVDLLINNAGFGDYGAFWETSLEKDLAMIDTNVRALHILTKLYLADMVKADRGQILNVASIAAFMPGPLMATYYATKAYVLRLSAGVNKELKKRGSKVRISALCPGPVKTNFEAVANIGFHFYGHDPHKIAAYALRHRRRAVIVPTLPVRLARLPLKLLPSSWTASLMYAIQNRRAK